MAQAVVTVGRRRGEGGVSSITMDAEKKKAE
jgi:hypothetical protein